MKKFSILICSLFMFAFSCEKEEVNCSGEPIPIPFETIAQGDTNTNCHILNINESQKVDSKVDLIIQSQAEYEKYVLCSSSLPPIDFSRKTLLAGRYTAAHMDLVESQRVFQDCNGKVVFEVILDRGGYTAVTDLFYFVIIPKISGNTQVTFDVGY